MVFLNLVVFSSWSLTATLTHCTLLSLLAHACEFFIKNIASPTPRRKQTPAAMIMLPNASSSAFLTALLCLSSAESFCSWTYLRSSSSCLPFCYSSFLATCTLLCSLRASSCSCSSWARCCSWLSVNELFDSSRDYHFCTYSDSLSAY